MHILFSRRNIGYTYSKAKATSESPSPMSISSFHTNHYTLSIFHNNFVYYLFSKLLVLICSLSHIMMIYLPNLRHTSQQQGVFWVHKATSGPPSPKCQCLAFTLSFITCLFPCSRHHHSSYLLFNRSLWKERKIQNLISN
jgi:hypothetical protein